MRELTRNVVVGVFTAGGVLATGALLFFFGELEPLFARGWDLRVAFNDAGGLRKGSLVTLNGVPVGSIDRVEIWADRSHPVLITGRINEGVLIPDPSVASVQASLLGSGARLELTSDLPLADPPTNYLADGTVVLRGRVEAIEARILRELMTRVDPIVASFGELGDLARNLNDLVRPGADGAPPDPESLRTAMRRLNETLLRAEGAVAAAESAFVGAAKWLDDEQMRTDFRDAAAGASVLMRDASIAANRIGALADSLAADAASLREGALPVLDRAGKALEELDRLLLAARTGDGTVGRLLKDPALFLSLIHI